MLLVGTGLYGFILIVTLVIVVVAVGMHVAVVQPSSPVPTSNTVAYETSKVVLPPSQALSFRGATRITQS